jgi:rubredoxin
MSTEQKELVLHEAHKAVDRAGWHFHLCPCGHGYQHKNPEPGTSAEEYKRRHICPKCGVHDNRYKERAVDIKRDATDLSIENNEPILDRPMTEDEQFDEFIAMFSRFF